VRQVAEGVGGVAHVPTLGARPPAADPLEQILSLRG
jgi:hypothetical protein